MAVGMLESLAKISACRVSGGERAKLGNTKLGCSNNIFNLVRTNN